AQQQEEKNNADDPSENLADGRRECGGSKLLANEAQHVLTSLSQNRRDLVLTCQMQRLTEHRRQGKHCPSQQGGRENNLDRYRCYRFERFARDTRVFHCRSRVELHYTSQVGNRLRTGQCKNNAYELHPNRGYAFMARLKEMRRQMWRTNGD